MSLRQTAGSEAGQAAGDSTSPGGSYVAGGIVTGQIAGLIMAVVVVLVFVVVYSTTIFYPVQVIGSFAFGEEALEGTNVSAILAGLFFHQAGPSLLWGFIYGVIAAKQKIVGVAESLGLGLGIGVVSMVGPYVLIPVLMNAIHGQDFWNREVPIGWDWIAHLVFGASFALFPIVRGALVSRSGS